MSDPQPCPIDCPNRVKPNSPEQKVRSGSLLFAAIMTAFLVYSCWSAERRNEQLSPAVWFPVTIGLAGALGVSFDKKDIAALIGLK